MTRRYDSSELSTALYPLTVTPTVADRIKGLAWYYRQGYSPLLRELALEERKRLVGAGKRPPLKPPEDWASVARSSMGRKPRRKADEEGATKRLVVRLSPAEKAAIEGLAYYRRVTVVELVRQLEEEDRKRLIEAGKCPPLRPPPAAKAHLGDRSQRAPRR